MQPPEDLVKVSGTKAELNTVVSYRSLREADVWSEALLKDLSNESGLGDAYRSLGLTRVSFWMQRNPDAAVVMWEGIDTDTLFERISVSPNPVLGKWRGLLRMWSGPEEADSYWDASRHKLFSWAADEQGADSEVTIHRDPAQLEAYREFCLDLQQDPSLMSLLARVRQRQGFTRIEAWHQHMNGSDLVLVLREAHDLDAAMSQLVAEDNEFDKRVMELLRGSLLQQSPPPSPAKLLTRCRPKTCCVEQHRRYSQDDSGVAYVGRKTAARSEF